MLAIKILKKLRRFVGLPLGLQINLKTLRCHQINTLWGESGGEAQTQTKFPTYPKPRKNCPANPNLAKIAHPIQTQKNLPTQSKLRKNCPPNPNLEKNSHPSQN